MKKLIATVFLSVAICVGSIGMSAAADFEKGLKAYNKGDFETALREWRPLASQGDAEAQYNLGVIYENGDGVIQDYIYAHMWWNVAASNGHAGARKNKDIITGRMTPADISKAQSLARECVRKGYKDCIADKKTDETKRTRDRTLKLDAELSSLAEQKARDLLEQLEQVRQYISHNLGIEARLTTSQPVLARASSSAFEMEFPDLTVLLGDVKLDFGTVYFELSRLHSETLSWRIKSSRQVEISEGNEVLGKIVWSKERFSGRYLRDKNFIISYDVDLQNLDLRSSDGISVKAGSLEISQDLRLDSKGLYGGPAEFVTRNFSLDFGKQLLSIARAGIISRVDGVDLIGLEALNKSIVGTKLYEAPLELLSTAIPAFLALRWGAYSNTVYFEGLETSDDSGEPFKIDRAHITAGYKHRGTDSEITLTASLEGLETSSADIPFAYRYGSFDLAMALENFPLREMLADTENIDPTSPLAPGQLGAITLGAVMSSSPILRADRLSIDTPSFSAVTQGQVQISNQIGPDGNFEISVRGFDQLIADAKSGGYGSSVDQSTILGLIFIRGLGEEIGTANQDTLVYRIEISPDLTLTVNGFDISQFWQ